MNLIWKILISLGASGIIVFLNIMMMAIMEDPLFPETNFSDKAIKQILVVISIISFAVTWVILP